MTTTRRYSPEALQHSKEKSDAMLEWLRGRGKTIIVIHDNPDPDCLASAMALRHLIAVKLNRDAVMTFSGMIGRSENLAMTKELGIMLTPLELVDLSEVSAVCMLDTQPGTGNNSLPPDCRVDVVIDHHPLREATERCRWVDVREEYGVTATIIYEYLLVQQVPIGTALATALFCAIKADTQDLGREATRHDRDAYLHLFPLANKRLLYEIHHPKLPLEYFQTLHRGMENATVYGNLLVVNLQKIYFPEVVAEMADLLIRLEGIETVLSIGGYNKELILSLRTTSRQHNAGEIIRRLVNGNGTAGGHGMMAGGKIDRMPGGQTALQQVEASLVRQLLEELAITDVTPKHLIVR
ncbi:bifunctional oligoribonuclease/PAP phosphatase NrnA [Geobacter sp. SVR]|uniref:DHH family phosphoesterase n=1 Tax=Geobacter sp. SVR TaxID=2495594 RepID=UPI00143EF49A|nr:DHH family phosphoesterase [Geobacter sp. SVR]BCS54399.1 DHH family phosphoesterase [Geobacter sp. SVR]GCF87432.1 DHH family phosphoesterase [Geobacter sp. SVR]